MQQKLFQCQNVCNFRKRQQTMDKIIRDQEQRCVGERLRVGEGGGEVMGGEGLEGFGGEGCVDVQQCTHIQRLDSFQQELVLLVLVGGLKVMVIVWGGGPSTALVHHENVHGVGRGGGGTSGVAVSAARTGRVLVLC